MTDDRFDHVLQQANYASLALKPEEPTLEEETLDDELYESLARAKKAAAAKGNSEAMLAEVARKRRAEQEALDRDGGANNAEDGTSCTCQP